ncbi:MAG: hypothetical protein IT380_03575 [Myxococcales bacterium]|nr:hypothetical protein [Myxococcales bacterium]
MVLLGGQHGRPGEGNVTAFEKAMRQRSGYTGYRFSKGCPARASSP